MVKIAANISMLFREMPLLDRFRASRAAGFDGVEMQFPYSDAGTLLARAAADAGMPVILINAPVMPPPTRLESRAGRRCAMPSASSYRKSAITRKRSPFVSCTYWRGASILPMKARVA